MKRFVICVVKGVFLMLPTTIVILSTIQPISKNGYLQQRVAITAPSAKRCDKSITPTEPVFKSIRIMLSAVLMEDDATVLVAAAMVMMCLYISAFIWVWQKEGTSPPSHPLFSISGRNFLENRDISHKMAIFALCMVIFTLSRCIHSLEGYV